MPENLGNFNLSDAQSLTDVNVPDEEVSKAKEETSPKPGSFSLDGLTMQQGKFTGNVLTGKPADYLEQFKFHTKPFGDDYEIRAQRQSVGQRALYAPLRFIGSTIMKEISI